MAKRQNCEVDVSSEYGEEEQREDAPRALETFRVEQICRESTHASDRVGADGELELGVVNEEL